MNNKYTEAKTNGEREEFKGNIEKALDYYLDALYFLETEFKNLSINSERKRQLAIRNLNHKINYLKNPGSELIVEKLPRKTAKEFILSNWLLLSVVALVFLFVFIYSRSVEGPNYKKYKDLPTKNGTEKTTSCAYTKMELKAYEVGTDKLIEEKTITDCFTHLTLPNSGGMTEVTNSTNTIRVTYFNTEGNVLRTLNIRFGEQGTPPNEWRANKGHDIFMNNTGTELNFIFGDRKVSKIKGTIKFSK